MITTTELKSLILNCFDDYLGKYNSTLPAIAVLPHLDYGYDYPPSNWVVTGIEVVIIKPKIRTKNALYATTKRRDWEIHLKNWDKSGVFPTVVETLINGLADATYQMETPIYVPYNEALGILESAKITVYEHIVRVA